jgi:tetratricopeptide (TPR) repeat protein
VPPRAIVIPFGVPPESRGLGLGLAALVHSFARLEGDGVGLAHLHGQRAEPANADADADADATEPMEAFIAPNAWKDLSSIGHTPSEVSIVLTGAFEPPGEGRGLLQLLAYDAKDGGARARVEAFVDTPRAGETISGAFDELWKKVGGGDIGAVRDIADLPWDALESVLRAERCALHDPLKGEPYDRLAAMMHLGRAVEEAPEARFPAGRLAAIAIDTATGAAGTRMADAARRALTRAIEDAPGRVELVEATAALELQTGDAAGAEARLERMLAEHVGRPRPYALLSEARRLRGDVDRALDAVHAGLAHSPEDPMLLTERGAVLVERGDPIAAEADWRRAMDISPLFPTAFANLTALALRRRDAQGGEELVDRALLAPSAHPEVLKKAIHLSLALEPDGLARAARLARLARALVAAAPSDAWGHFVLARADAQLGERDAATQRLEKIARDAAGSAIATEAQRGLFTLREPNAALEIEALLRAAQTEPEDRLESLAARGRRLAQAHPVWPAHFALGVVERRRARWPAARAALEDAVAASEGCTPAHLELVSVAVALEDADAALRHAARAIALEGPTARTLAAHAAALLAAGRVGEAKDVLARAQRLDPNDEGARALAERITIGDAPAPGSIARIRGAFARWLK